VQQKKFRIKNKQERRIIKENYHYGIQAVCRVPEATADYYKNAALPSVITVTRKKTKSDIAIPKV